MSRTRDAFGRTMVEPLLRSVAELLLTEGERRSLGDDLAEMARQRRRAETESAWLPMA